MSSLVALVAPVSVFVSILVSSVTVPRCALLAVLLEVAPAGPMSLLATVETRVVLLAPELLVSPVLLHHDAPQQSVLLTRHVPGHLVESLLAVLFLLKLHESVVLFEVEVSQLPEFAHHVLDLPLPDIIEFA